MIRLSLDDARALVLHLMAEKDPLWVRRANRHTLQAWLANYAANL